MATPAECKLWTHVSNRQVAGAKFSRQIQIGPYYGDLVCRAKRLVVELDGAAHDQAGEADARRTRWLEDNGYHMIRFVNEQVFLDIEGVVQAIETVLVNLPTPARDASHPSRKREGC